MMMNIKLKFQRTVLVRICQFSKQLVVNNFRIGLSDVELAKNPPNTVISESCPFGALVDSVQRFNFETLCINEFNVGHRLLLLLSYSH